MFIFLKMRSNLRINIKQALWSTLLLHKNSCMSMKSSVNQSINDVCFYKFGKRAYYKMVYLNNVQRWVNPIKYIQKCNVTEILNGINERCAINKFITFAYIYIFINLNLVTVCRFVYNQPTLSWSVLNIKLRLTF